MAAMITMVLIIAAAPIKIRIFYRSMQNRKQQVIFQPAVSDISFSLRKFACVLDASSSVGCLTTIAPNSSILVNV